MNRRSLALLVIAALAGGVDATSQSPTGSIGGVIVSSATADAQPVRLAIVTLAGDGTVFSRSAVSDDRGRFVFEGVAPGRYTLTAGKRAYLSMAYGANRPGRPGTSIALAAGQQLTNLRMSLPKGGVITGRLTDHAGQPAPNVPILVLRAGAGASGSGAKTDDRGEYRIFGLMPGDYYIGASVPRLVGDIAVPDAATGKSRAVNFAATFYPGTTDARSFTAVTVGISEERTGVDFSLQLVPTATVAGAALLPDGSSVPVRIVLDPDTADRQLSLYLNGSTMAQPGDGHFSFQWINPGAYRLAAVTESASNRLFAMTTLQVNGESFPNVALTLRPALRLSGRLVFDGAAPRPADLSAIKILVAQERTVAGPGLPWLLEAVSLPSTTITRDGAFEASGLLPGRYILRAVLPPGGGWWMRSAIVNGRDVIDSGLEIGGADITSAVITFSDRASELSGRLQTPEGAPATDYFVVMYPADRTLWRADSRRILSTRPGTDGRFEFLGLPGGDYLIAALTDVDPADLPQATFLEGLTAASIKVTLADGERKTQNLKIGK